MISPETIAIIQTIIYLAGIGGVVYWGRKWFKALQGAVDAQKTTIDAQKAFMESMTNFLKIADAPRMMERYEAYRNIVDHEKEVILKRFSEEKKEFLERLEDSDVGITNLLDVVRGMTPYVPHNKRMEIIESANLAKRESDVLRVVAETAPDLVAEENNKRLELLREERKELVEAMKQSTQEILKRVTASKADKMSA